MLLTRTMIVGNNPELDRIMADGLRVYDQALYFYRQRFFDFVKRGIVHETPLSWQQVLKDIKLTDAYRQTNLDIWSVNKIVHEAHDMYWAFVKAKRAYTANPSGFAAPPRLPGYMHRRHKYRTVRFDRTRLGKTGCGVRQVRLPKSGYFITLPPDIRREDIHFVEVSKCGHKTKIGIVYEAPDSGAKPGESRMGIDLGVNNLMAITIDDQPCSWIVKGSEIKRVNQNYNRIGAERQAKLETCNKSKTSLMLSRLAHNRSMRIRSLMHLYSRMVVDLCVEHEVGTVIIGHNKGWKREASLGKRNNQNFVQIPFSDLIGMLQYKCRLAGIDVLVVEESYTSKADHLLLEPMKHLAERSGRRHHRGLFISGWMNSHLNADVNGAVGMLRKGGCPDSVIESMRDRNDLGSPKVLGHKRRLKSRRKNKECAVFHSMHGSGIIVCQPVSDQSHPAT